MEAFEDTVSDRHLYNEPVLDTQEWPEAANNTSLLCGDSEVGRLPLYTNQERLKVSIFSSLMSIGNLLLFIYSESCFS